MAVKKQQQGEWQPALCTTAASKVGPLPFPVPHKGKPVVERNATQAAK